jgi:polyisoprenoid-binding protein YceI
MIRKTAAVLFLAALASPLHAADTWVVDKNQSSAQFQVRHLVSKVGGRFSDFSGTIVADAAKPESSSVEFAVKTASIDTDQEQRDKHLRSADFFDVEKYPEITFKSSKVMPKGNNHFDVAGTLTMHGVAKEITLPVTFLGTMKDGAREKAGFETQVTLNRKDYGIIWNKALDGGGMVLSDDVLVTINIEAGKKQPEAAAPPVK